MGEKIRETLKRRKLDDGIILSVAALYLINRLYLRGTLTGWMGYLAACYLNDFLCPILLLAYSNILLGTRGMGLRRLKEILLFCFCAGVVWEYGGQWLKPSSVNDPLDFAAYGAGGTAYWLLSRCRIYFVHRAGKEF